MIERQNFKLHKNENYIHSKILENIIKESDFPKAVVEEINSELWYETLHGPGKLTFKNNVKYEGHLHYGLLESTKDTPSTLIFPDGTSYTGTLKNSQITGKGKYTFPNGSTYVGEVNNGLRHGHGVFKSNNGIVFEGEWHNGLKHGKGKIIQGNMVLEGTWVKGVISGEGRIKWKNGNVYEGECKDNLISGNGYLIWYNRNEKYTGRWKLNMQNGYGVHIWYEPRGEQKYLRDRYVGEWLNGKRNGYGKFYYSNGTIYEGYWYDNQKDGFGVQIYPDRTKYIGMFKEDRTIDQNILMLTVNMKRTSITGQSNINNQTSSTLNHKNAGATYRTGRRLSTSKSPANLNNARETNSIQTKEGLSTIKEIDKRTINSNNNNFTLKQSKSGTTNINTTEEENNTTGTNIDKKREQISKALDEIKLQIDISDIQEMNPEINKSTLKEIDNLLLRNLSFITNLYLYACGKETLKDAADLATSIISKSVVSETKSVFKNELNVNKFEQEDKKESFIDYDQIYTNDLYFCLDFKGLWKLFKEVGLLSPTFTLAMFNRFYFQNPNNYIEMFYLPNEYTETKENKVYDYLYSMIHKSKNDFDSKYRAQIDQFNILVGRVPNVSNPTMSSNTIPLAQQQDNTLITDDDEYKVVNDIQLEMFNMHNGDNIILLRYFYELLIRVAYLKFNHVHTMSFEMKVKNLFSYLKYYFKSKKRNTDSTLAVVTVLDMKFLKNWENNLEAFITRNKSKLLHLYKIIYSHYIYDNALLEKQNDMAITYKYLYECVLLKIKSIKDYIKNKLSFIELITVHHRNRMNITYNDLDRIDVVKYIEQVMSNEFIFYEFCEIMFILNKKYQFVHENELQEDDVLGNIYDIIIKSLDERNKKEKMSYRKDYYYPKLKTHLQIEKLMQEELERRKEEEKKKKEKERYEKERMRFTEEDVNVYIEEEDESRSESFSEF